MIDEIRLDQLKTSLWRNANKEKQQPQFSYEDEIDTLFMYFISNKSAPVVTHYLDQNVAVLFNADSNEIVGFSIEGFERSFSSKYSPSNLWRMSRLGVRINGLKEFTFCVMKEDEIKINQPIKVEKEIQLKPEFAFA